MSRRGLSPILAEILLIIIVVSACGLIYFYQIESARIAGQQLSISIQEVYLKKSPEGLVLFMITVLNDGDRAITKVDVYLGDMSNRLILVWNPDISSSNPLPPGSSSTANISSSLGVIGTQEIDDGKFYSLVVRAYSDSGEKTDVLTSVYCEPT